MNLLFLLVFCATIWCTLVEHHRFMAHALKCADQYRKQQKHVNAVHMMCKYKKMGKPVKITPADIKVILDEHNKYRANPGIGTTAMKMSKMYWDPRLAELAQYYAQACRSWKSTDMNYAWRESPGTYIVPGYNTIHSVSMFFGAGPKHRWKAGIKLWYDEGKNFKYGTGDKNYKKWSEHYSTMMVDASPRIGCGSALCNTGGKKNIPVDVCTYYEYMWADRLKEPFDAGKPCSGCPGRCVGGTLCDTKGKVCYNKGQLNFKTNSCWCHPQYTGENCENLLCFGDHHMCPKKCADWKKKKKAKRRNCCEHFLLRMNCPVMCELCSKDCKAGKMYFAVPQTGLMDNTGKIAITYPAGKLTALKGHEKCQLRKKGPFWNAAGLRPKVWQYNRRRADKPVKKKGGKKKGAKGGKKKPPAKGGKKKPPAKGGKKKPPSKGGKRKGAKRGKRRGGKRGKKRGGKRGKKRVRKPGGKRKPKKG